MTERKQRFVVVRGVLGALLVLGSGSGAFAKSYQATCSGDFPEFTAQPGQTVTISRGATLAATDQPTAHALFRTVPDGSLAFALNAGESTRIYETTTLKAVALAEGAQAPSLSARCWVTIDVR